MNQTLLRQLWAKTGGRFIGFNSHPKSGQNFCLSIKRLAHQMSGQKVAVNGVNIHYERVGTGPNTLLLLPGAIGSTRTDFPHQLDAGGLNRDVFTVIAWDPPGYGYSRPPERDYRDFYRKDAKIAADFMKALGIGKYSLVGWSDGGITSLIIAADNPMVVHKLVVFGSNAYVSPEDKRLMLAIDDVNKWSASARRAYEEVYGADTFAKLWSGFVEAYCQYDDICMNDLKRIKAPTLVLHGDKDPLMTAEHPTFLVDNIKGARLYRFPDGRHNIHHKYHKQFNELIEKFIIE